MIDQDRRLRGIVLMFVAVAVFAVMDALLKHLATSYPPIQVAYLRAVSSLPFVFLTCAITGRMSELRPRRPLLHLARGVISILMLWCFVWALAHLSLANTYAITLSAPLLVVPFAALFLGEKADGHTWFAILAGLAGVLVILKPTAAGFVNLAGIAALGTAVCWAIVVVMVRLMSSTETTAAMVFWFLLLSALGAGALAVRGWVAIDSHRLGVDRGARPLGLGGPAPHHGSVPAGARLDGRALRVHVDRLGRLHRLDRLADGAWRAHVRRCRHRRRCRLLPDAPRTPADGAGAAALMGVQRERSLIRLRHWTSAPSIVATGTRSLSPCAKLSFGCMNAPPTP